MRAILVFVVFLLFTPSFSHGEMYRWVDEKGTLHFTDDLTKIPEQYRSDAELRKTPRETSPETAPEKRKEIPVAPQMPTEPEAVEVNLFRRHELWLAEVVLNERVKRYLVVDSGASFMLINHQTAKDLGLTIDDTTPFLAGSTVSGTILTPLVSLKSVRVGTARVEDVEAIVYSMPSGQDGLLGNSFLNKFRLVLDSVNSKMILHPLKGATSPDRPGGFGRDYWVGQFRFYHRNLEDLKALKRKYEGQGAGSELNRVNNAIRYFENQLSELERKASFAGVPRNWRE